MSKVRVHQLAKELGVEPKDLIARLEKIRIRGKKVQSSLEDSEVAAIRAAIGATERPKVTVGAEKVVVDRMITAEDQNLGEVQAHEKIVERRVKANVIRRRTSRVDVATQQPLVPPVRTEETPPAVEETPVSDPLTEAMPPVDQESAVAAVPPVDEVSTGPAAIEETVSPPESKPAPVEPTQEEAEPAAERQVAQPEVAAPEPHEVVAPQVGNGIDGFRGVDGPVVRGRDALGVEVGDLDAG